MSKQIAFLRGINVGNIRIKMADLKVAFEVVGCTNVKTYLQTGNVVYESDKTMEDMKPILEKHLSQTFNYEAFVLLYDFGILTNIIAQYPFSKDKNHHAYIVFISNEAIFDDLKNNSNTLNKGIKAGQNVIYWKVLRGESTDAPFAKILAKAKYKSTTTVRNINTLEKMVEG
jgi:uncharacterized protein (DUF1697 family)